MITIINTRCANLSSVKFAFDRLGIAQKLPIISNKSNPPTS